jgi:hypothetical protein
VNGTPDQLVRLLKDFAVDEAETARLRDGRTNV